MCFEKNTPYLSNVQVFAAKYTKSLFRTEIELCLTDD